MPKETAPVLEIDFELTEKEYVRAALLLSRRVGVLRSLPAVVILALLLLTAGMLAFGWFPGYPLIPLILCLCCPLLLLLFFVVEPAGVRRQAEKDYETYHALMEPTRLQLYPDNVVTITPTLTLRDQYALVVELLETKELLVFVKDRERRLVLPKRCLPPEKEKEALEFLRLTFTRKRRLMHGWIF